MNPFDHVLLQFPGELGSNPDIRLMFLALRDAYNVLAEENSEHASLTWTYSDPFAEVLHRFRPYRELTSAYRHLAAILAPHIRQNAVLQ